MSDDNVTLLIWAVAMLMWGLLFGLSFSIERRLPMFELISWIIFWDTISGNWPLSIEGVNLE